MENVNPWRRFRKDRPVVHQVTDAQPSLSNDIRKREISYLIKMGIRIVCLILAVAVPSPWPVKALFVAGAVLLPYVAVLGANQRGHTPPPRMDLTSPNQTEIPRHRREIGS
ncbi:DUF3099 domain-containing protein [Microbispora triticiradicis]|uniref:DUF3099 domain-containing protein n=3 Tax=Microbispora TaxID=2005 RepID=A0ABY3M266_9ACTN|nr:DUF3099 domain-containing protein [Microbispora triticiradicis]TLP59799.1 DUF3099 domain-containing protein [Microbispora fusca]TYB63513.1 DUF3099 domain-containing protein [Microbispora tritici]